MSSPQPDASAPAEARLEELRRNGRWRADPVRFRYLESLAGRIPAQPAPVQALLRARLETGLAQYPPSSSVQPAAAGRRSAAKPAPGPLAALAQALRAARPDAAAPGTGDELASARRFRDAWDAQRALEKLDQALAQRPAQAGPLNSHALVLQSLELMRDASPQYLRQFVLHVESLQWLAAAGGGSAGPQGAARKGGGRTTKAAGARGTRKRRGS